MGDKTFGKGERKQKIAGKSKKLVDMGGCGWYYIRALAKRGLRERGPRGRGNLENDTDKREKRQLILK